MATVSDHKTLNCPVCLKRYISPRVLPCQHTLCEKCIDTNITSQVGSVGECLCPLCKSSIVPPDPKLAMEKLAKTFPLHSLICSLLKIADVSNDKENLCEPCKNDGYIVNADLWCTDCSERLCFSCDKSHRRSKLQKNHRSVPISEMEKELQSKINFDENCDRHHSREIESFCVEHRKLCCSICIETDHRLCNDVRSIHDIATEQALRPKPAHPGIIGDIKKIKAEMAKIMSSKTKNVTEISQEKWQIIWDVDKKIDTIIGELNTLRNEFRNKTDHLHKETETSILNDQKIVESFMTNIENLEEILEIVETRGSSRQKFATYENITTQITSHYQQVKSRLAEDTEVHLRLESGKGLSDIEDALKSFDTVHVSTKPSTGTNAVLQSIDEIIRKANSRLNIRTDMCAAQVQKRNLMTSSVAFVKAVTRENLDVAMGTWITGGTFCSDGRLLMADWGKNRLLELNDEYNLVKEHRLDGSPTDVAVSNNDDIYIAVNQRYIYKCTLDTGLTVFSRIKAPIGTCGITVSGDKIIVATNIAVVILKQDGSTVQSLRRYGDGYSYVATSQQTVCHTSNNDVVCRTIDGKEIFRYQHQQLRHPVDICVDKHNNMYTCGYKSRNVHQVSLDGHRSRIIVDNLHSISQPVSVMFHPKRDELIVTSDGQNTVFEVYRLG